MTSEPVKVAALVEYDINGYDSTLSITIGKSVVKFTTGPETIRNALIAMGILVPDITAEEIEIEILKVLNPLPDEPPPELGEGS